MIKKRSFLFCCLFALLFCALGNATTFAKENLSISCSGDVHIIPILKDQWRATTSISCNGPANGLSSSEFANAVSSCYVSTTLEVYNDSGDYDNGYCSQSGMNAYDSGLNSWALASIRCSTSAYSEHYGENDFCSGITRRTSWSK